MTTLPLAVVVFSVMTAACSAVPARDPARDREAIASVTAQTQAAENAGSVEQMRVHFADDLVLLAPNTPAVIGADSVAAAMHSFFGAFGVEIQYTSEEIIVSGDWAFDRGTYRQTLTPKKGGAPMIENGKYLWLYRRSPDGVWKQSRVIWNSSDPLPSGGV